MSPSRTHDGELLALLKPLRSGTLFLLGPGALSISVSIISKTRLIEPLIFCHISPQKSQDEEEVLRHFGYLLFEFNPATPSSYRFCARPPSLLQFWRCTPEEDVLVQDQFDGGEDIEGVIHHQGLSYVPKIIRTKLTTEKTREFVARKYYGDLQLFPISTHCQKGTSYNLILVIINRLTRWKNLSMDFVTGLPISTVWKGDSYNSSLIIVSLQRWYTTSRCRQRSMHPGLRRSLWIL